MAALSLVPTAYALIVLPTIWTSNRNPTGALIAIHLGMVVLMVVLVVSALLDLARAGREHPGTEDARVRWTALILMVCLVGVPAYFLKDPLRGEHARAARR